MTRKLDLPPETYRRLDTLAASLGKSLGDVIIELLDKTKNLNEGYNTNDKEKRETEELQTTQTSDRHTPQKQWTRQKMSPDIFPKIYFHAEEVASGKKTMKETREKILSDESIQEISQRSTIAIYTSMLSDMMNGNLYTVSMGAEAMNYFLTRIRKEKGYKELAKALEAFQEHIDYSQSEKNPMTKAKNVFEWHHFTLHENQE